MLYLTLITTGSIAVAFLCVLYGLTSARGRADR